MRVPIISAPSTIDEDDVPRHEKVTVDAKKRMKLNGETTAQMAHVEAIKSAGGVSPDPEDGDDTSQDQAWTYDTSKEGLCKDRYVLWTTFLYLGVKLPIFAIPMLLFHIPPMITPRLYISMVPDNTHRIFRSKLFYFSFVCVLFWSIPAILLILLSLILDNIFYYFFSLTYATCTWRWAGVSKSMAVIRPYRNGPSLIRHATDFYIAVMGQMSRQSVFETLYMVGAMWILIPWLKYYVNANPYIYDLHHRMVQQISTEMADLGSSSQVADTARVIISMARQERDLAARVDIWNFVPHYPYPPPDRRWAIGLQAGGTKYPGKFTLVVHTTHAVCNSSGSTEQFVLSNSCEEPIYRVMLWYSNPFHFLTGWVEASISNGQPSQPNKRMGGEHPMWLVTSRTPAVSSRDSWTGSGMIDGFFDYWLPVFVHEMRRYTYFRYLRERGDPDCEQKALSIANRKYQQVHSQDGISRPRTFLGRSKYDLQDTLTELVKIGTTETPIQTKATKGLAGLADTSLGRAVCAYQQAGDLHDEGGILEGVQSFRTP